MTIPAPNQHVSDFLDDAMPPRFEGTVWHYTSAEGILGILTTSSIWASSVSQLNDRNELRHGFEVIESRWASFRGRSVPTRPEIDGWLKQAHAKLDASVLANSYIACGSTLGRSQSQFLQYGSYAVGINGAVPLTKALVEQAESERQYVESGQFTTGWRHVIYEENAKRDFVDNLFVVLANLALIQREYPGEASQASDTAIECVLRAAAYMKDESFADEKEVRLYGRADNTRADLFFRVGKYGVVPYIRVEISKEIQAKGFPIMKINLGPGLPEPASAEAGLRIALDRFKLDHIEIANHVGARRV